MLETLLASEITGDLLVLFHRNPGLIDTLDGVARRIGRTGNAIEEDIRGLVNLGILKTRRIGRTEVLLLDRARDREVLDAIAKHLRNLEGVEKIDNAKFKNRSLWIRPVLHWKGRRRWKGPDGNSRQFEKERCRPILASP